jgi:nucleotide-binding universal stress UspA family protein
MQAPPVLLLCHHGTEGAARAEQLAYDIARPGQTTIVHCLIVPELWAGMQGDDWLNNASTRDTFAHYVEQLLEKDAKRELTAVEARCAERGLAYKAVVRFGDPAECAVAVAAEEKAERVVIGPPRAKGLPGLRSRMDLERLVRDLACPLLIASRR